MIFFENIFLNYFLGENIFGENIFGENIFGKNIFCENIFDKNIGHSGFSLKVLPLVTKDQGSTPPFTLF